MDAWGEDADLEFGAERGRNVDLSHGSLALVVGDRVLSCGRGRGGSGGGVVVILQYLTHATARAAGEAMFEHANSIVTQRQTGMGGFIFEAK